MESQKPKFKSQKCNSKVKSYFLILTFIFAFCLLPFNFALAENHTPPIIPCPKNVPCLTDDTQKDPQKVKDHVIGTFGAGFLTTFLGLAAVTAVVFIIVGGLQLHLAFGNEEAMTKAKKTLIWAIVGLVIAILSVAIVQIISKLEF